MKQLYPDDYWKVTINWNRPSKYEKILNHGHSLDDQAHLYMISGHYSSGAPKVLYIGKTYGQCVSKRLNQKDHKNRFKEILEGYPNHRIKVSYGCVEMEEGKRTDKRINEIEQILIYSNNPKHAHNIKNFNEHGVKGSYCIKNTGSRKTLAKKICLGVFIK